MAISGNRNSGHQKLRCDCDTSPYQHHQFLGRDDVRTSCQRSQIQLPIPPPYRASSPESSAFPLVAGGASQYPDQSFESLKRTLSSNSGRKSLYTMPSEQATRIINDLERGSRKDSSLCAYHRERFAVVLRKMCCEHKLLPSSYTITDELDYFEESPSGRGGNADVWRGLHQGSKVAIKVLRVRTGSDLPNVERKFCREVVLWKQFRHPNLLPLAGAIKSSCAFMMVSEWMEHGTIMDFITVCPETNRLKLLADIARGLKYLHDWPSVHADLKSANILIDSNRSARIADFGLTNALYSHPMSISMTAPAQVGTLRWMAPELFDDGSHPTKASDIYALGMVAYEVFAHEGPFSRFYQYLVPGLVFSGKRPERPANREILGLSDNVWMLVEQCWDGNPTVRPHITDILSFFEAASRRWVSLTSGTVANLRLDRPIIHRPPTGDSTSITSEVMWWADGTTTGDQNLIVTLPSKAWRLLPMSTRAVDCFYPRPVF